MERNLPGISTGDDGARRRRQCRTAGVPVYVVVLVPRRGLLVTRARSYVQQRGVPVLPRRGEDVALGGLYLLRQRLPNHCTQRDDLDLRCAWNIDIADTFQNSHRLSYYTVNGRFQIHGYSGSIGGTSKSMQ